jgi:hypothetical protein
LFPPLQQTLAPQCKHQNPHQVLYSFPEIGQWSFPIPQSAMGILWLSKTIYPEQFEDIDFEEEVNSYYKDFFGVTYTELGGKNLDGRGIPVQE